MTTRFRVVLFVICLFLLLSACQSKYASKGADIVSTETNDVDQPAEPDEDAGQSPYSEDDGQSPNSNGFSLTTDQMMIPVGVSTTVTITLKWDGNPLPDTLIRLEAPGKSVVEGKTDVNGEWIVPICPQGYGKCLIWINETPFHGKLFAVTPGMGVLGVSLTGANNQPLSHFNVWAQSAQNSDYGDCDGNTAYIPVFQGENLLLVTSTGSANEPAYFLTNRVNVIAGQINKVNLNIADIDKTTLQLSYNNEPLYDADVFFQPTDVCQPWFKEKLGITGPSGELVLYASPGSFSFTVEKKKYHGSQLLLTSENISLPSGELTDLSWDDENCGQIQLNLSGPVHPIDGMSIMLDGYSFEWQYENKLTLNSGNHVVNAFSFIHNLNGQFLCIPYGPLSGETLSREVLPGTVNTWDLDLALKSVELADVPETIIPGQTLAVSANILTNSGYHLYTIQNAIFSLDLTDSKGKVVQVYKGMDFHPQVCIPVETAEGEYLLSGNVYLSDLYGQFNMEPVRIQIQSALPQN